jgi:hypothetical protein
MATLSIEFHELWSVDPFTAKGQPLKREPVAVHPNPDADVVVRVDGTAIVDRTALPRGVALVPWCSMLADFIDTLEESTRSGYTLEGEPLGRVALKFRRAGDSVKVTPTMRGGGEPPIEPFDLSFAELQRAVYAFKEALRKALMAELSKEQAADAWARLWGERLWNHES